MPKILLLPLVLLTTFLAAQTPQETANALPELNKIKTATLAPSYSCRSRQEFRRGYQHTALFLSDASLDRNGPDLLFNGACGSPDYFQGQTAGDDMSLIADLGEVALESLSTGAAFSRNGKKVVGNDAEFKTAAPVVQGHSYALLISKSDLRGLLVFTVAAYEPNKKVEIRYSVKEYQLMNVTTQSKGFNWDATSTVDTAAALKLKY